MKPLETFREIVRERGERLRTQAFEHLQQLKDEPSENVVIDSRPATISIIVQPRADGSLRVVVQGFMKSRFLPWKDVALDGFYKSPDGTVTAMPSDEFYDFD
jgi:hypothetical protein